MRDWKRFLALCLGLTLTLGQTAYAAELLVLPFPTEAEVVTGENGAPGVNVTTEETTAQTSIEDPIVVAEGGVLMDASTGKVLYGKNQDQPFYPASITKVMTALVVLENCKLDEMVTFSSTATTNLESGAVSLNITEGDQLTVEQSLYGLLLKSANEIGNGLAEHVGGSIRGFADMMNAKAAALGCKNTHFTNPHGLNDSAHKTTPYDMALILRAALENPTFRKIDTTTSYNFPATKKSAARTITMGHKMMYSTDSRYYEGIIGGKTGYTSLAGNTLVTGAERNGVRLVAVVMKAKGTQYTDTKAMLDYGFENYNVLTGGATAAAGNTEEQQGPGVTGTTSTEAGWQQDAIGWYYIKTDNSRAINEWLTVDGQEYCFDQSGYMVENHWVEAGGKWYYLGTGGALLKNTVTPDNYTVGADGGWIQ